MLSSRHWSTERLYSSIENRALMCNENALHLNSRISRKVLRECLGKKHKSSSYAH